MKKLIAMIGAVAMSFGLFADAFTSVNDDIQTRELGDSNIVGSSEESVGIHWWDDNFATTGYEQPAVVSNDTTLIDNTQYLKVETDSSPLLRTFTPVTTGETGGEYGKVDIADRGLFIDTKVRMTGFESDPTPQGAENKLLVWLKAVTDEDAGGVGYTNLMVTCGFWDQGAVTPTNYVVKAAGLDVKPDEWVRLTIRADKDTTDNVAKFKVFVNEKQVTADVEGGELSVFPSLVGESVVLSAAGFQGNGGINSVGLLTAADAPDFAADPTILTVTWNEGVTGFTVGAQKIDVTGEGTTNLVIASDALTDIVVTPTFQQDPQFELKGYKLGGEEKSPEEDGSAKFSMVRYEENLTLAIEAKQSRVGATLFVNGQPFGEYAFVKEAIGALATIGEFNSAKITLAMDEAITDFGDWSALSGDITLDLNGKTVSVDTEKAWAGKQSEIWGEYCLIDNAGATLTITNSAATCGQLIGSTGVDGVAILCNNSEVTLANADIKYDGKIWSEFDETREPPLYGSVTIYGGKFKPKAEFKDEFNGLAEGLVWGTEDADGFFPVEEKTADYVAQIVGGDSFESLAEAVEAATTGNTIKMLADVDIQATGLTIPAEKTITLDLAGKIITAANTATGHIQVNGGLTVTDTAEGGQIVSGANGTYGLIQLAMAKTDDAAAFTLNAGTISAYFDTVDKDGEHPSYGITVKGDGSTVTVNGGEIYAGYMAISIHGSMSQKAVVDVNAGTVRSSDDFAIYSATTATVTVDGGTVKGGTGAVMIKGGTLNVTGGELISKKPGETGEGTDGTSGADYAVIRVNPVNADATVSLTGGTFTADEGTEILAYTPVAGKTADITKGKGVEIPAPADYKWDENGKLVAKVYVAQVGDDKYETVDEALAKVQELKAAGTYPINVTALAEVTIPGTVAGDSLTLAKNGTIAITANSWTITGTVSGKVTLAYGKTLVVPAGSDVTVSPTSADYEIKKSTADDKDTYTVAEVAKEITITLVKTDSIADIKTNGTSVVGAVKLPADTTSIEIELVAASTIKIPVYKVSYAEVGANVTTKTATYTIADGNVLTFSAEEASSSDTQVTEEVAKQAFKDLGETEAAKIEALTTGSDPIGAKAVATWINGKNLDPATVLAGEFVKASVKLDTTAPITKDTSVKIDTLTKGEGTVLTFKVKVGDDDVSAKEAITSMVKATDDLTKKAWDLDAAVAIEGETVKVTPPTGKTQAFVKVVIPADVPAAE